MSKNNYTKTYNKNFWNWNMKITILRLKRPL